MKLLQKLCLSVCTILLTWPTDGSRQLALLLDPNFPTQTRAAKYLSYDMPRAARQPTIAISIRLKKHIKFHSTSGSDQFHRNATQATADGPFISAISGHALALEM
ncbi:hypothetical protein K431DRAFT_7864 [Polychaeton citri CBS 116435]|uniref:Secreted protein n=1 Tax=Polychaeton citri CBS 116435 TaxID=1314669 RepID=A0A9P4QCQ4_9PEZI|nr:hypothetical protein K431DRAFT_7864 [Polychaeton citri CBS 116435]